MSTAAAAADAGTSMSDPVLVPSTRRRGLWGTALTAALALLGLAGCSLPPAAPLPPPAPRVPAAFQAAPPGTPVVSAASVPPGSAPPAPWWQRPDDPALAAVVALALRDNRDLGVAAAQLAQARAQVALDEVARRPTLVLAPQAGGALASRTVDPALSLVSTGSAAAGGAVPGVAVQTDSRSARLRLPLEAGWEPDLWGRLALGAQASARRGQAAEDDLQAARLALAAAVATTFEQLRLHRAQAAVLQQQLALRERQQAAAQARLAQGLADGAAVLAGQAQLAEVRGQLRRVAERVALDRQALALLCGTTTEGLPALAAAEAGAADVADVVEPPGEVASSGPPPAGRPRAPLPLLSDLPARALLRRPDVRASQARLQAVLDEAGATRAEYLPTLSLTTSAGLESSALARLLQPGSSVWSLAAQIGLPLLDGGRRDARWAAAQARVAAAAQQHEAGVLHALREVEDALTSAAAWQDQFQQEGLALQALRQRARQAAQRADAGLGSRLAELDLQQAVLQRELQWLEARSQVFIAQATLRRVLALP